MLMTIVGGILAASLAAAPQTDTTFAVQPGSRLQLRNMGGDIVVRTWDRDAVRIEADHSARTVVSVASTGSVVSVRARSSFGPATVVDYRITVPASMNLDLAGTYSDIQVEGAQGEVSAQTVQGDVTIHGGRGNVDARSVQGVVRVDGTRGQVRANSTSEGVRISNVVGEVSAETVSGDIVLTGVDSRQVEVATVSGDLFYDGTIQDGGRYAFVTHNGDVTATVPPRVNAAISFATMNGDLDSSFDVPSSADEHGRRRHTFTLGSGSAQVEFETFSGDIRLRRPGEVRAPEIRSEDEERGSGRTRAPRPPRVEEPPRPPAAPAPRPRP